jgi:PKD repeat protein
MFTYLRYNKKMKLRFIFIPFLLFSLWACRKKEYPQSVTENDSIFYFSATIDGNPVKMDAGVNDYYMYSSYRLDSSSNLYSFTGDLKRSDCNCGSRLQIGINADKVYLPNASVQIDSALKPAAYPLYAGDSYLVQFQSASNKTPASWLWDFGDNSTSTQQNPTHLFQRGGKYNVKLTIVDSGFCQSSISNIIKVGMPGSCAVSVKDSAYGSNAVSFKSAASGAAPFTYQWNFGDGSSTVPSANPTHSFAIGGSYPVHLRVIDANQDTAYANINTITANDQSSCRSLFSVASSTAVPVIPLSAINITWTDESGSTYTSVNAAQPFSSYFNVTSVTDFDNNEKGEKTKILHVKFKCRVYNGLNYKTIDNAVAVICVSYK